MSREAEKLILSGRGVILDGTFVNRSQRQQILALAHRDQIPLLAIHCVVSDDITQERLAQRASAGKDVSDGRWEIYVQQKDAFQALDDIPAADRLELDTDATLDTLAVACEKFMRTRLARHY
jgi:predicted kinase